MTNVELLIQKAKQGDTSAANDLMDRYRNYLRVLLLTGDQKFRHLQARFDESDVVQNTLMDAFRDLSKFQGQDEPELLAWLRSLLACNLADLVRAHHAGKRDIKRQQRIGAALSQSSVRLEQFVPQDQPKWGGLNSRQEAVVLLADALARLPADYREVIVLRHMQRDSFEEIAKKMNRTPGAVRMLWTRAIASWKSIIEDSSETSGGE